jgi:type IV pilus assembly protein PilM
VSVVALDISSATLAAVEVGNGGPRSQLRRTALEALPPGLVQGGEIADGTALAGAVRRFWRTSGMRGRRVRLGIANRRVLVRLMDMPAVDDPAERRRAVDRAVTEHLPIAAADAVVDSRSVGRYWSDGETRERRMVVAADRGMIEDLVGSVRAAGLQPVGIDLEAFALLRALLPVPLLIDEGSADAPARAVCHIGSDITQVAVAVERSCQFTRTLDAGASGLVRDVARATALEPGDAERLMGLCGFGGPPPEGVDATTVAAVRGALRAAVAPLAQDVAQSLQYYRNQPDARTVEGVLIAGPGVLLRGLDAHLAGALEAPVAVADPREQVEAGGIDLTTANRVAVALGLALDAPEEP